MKNDKEIQKLNKCPMRLWENLFTNERKKKEKIKNIKKKFKVINRRRCLDWILM